MPPKQSVKKIEPWKPHVDLRSSAPISWFDISGYRLIHDSLPNLNQFLKKPDALGNYNLDTNITIHKWEPEIDSPMNMGTLHIQPKGSNQILPMKAFCKIIPLMDTYSWIRDQKVVKESQIGTFWRGTNEDIANKYNKGYVEVLCTYLLNQYARENHSPHFLRYFGAFRAVSENYIYSLKEDFEDYRFRTWFWERVQNGDITLQVKEKLSGNYLTQDEIYTVLKPDDEFLTEEETDDEEDSDVSSLSESSLSSIEIDTPFPENTSGIVPDLFDISELESVGSLDLSDSDEVVQMPSGGHHSERLGDNDSSSDGSDISYSDIYEINAILPYMPVVLMFSQKADGELDKFLENEDSQIEYEKWTAWLWQIIAALYQAQKNFMFTHNDLHTNNIVWCNTSLEYLYYKYNNISYKVPTYGYIFQIIDFGRSIYTAQNIQSISMDFFPGFEAEGQYNFGPFYDDDYPKVHPNRNFDLCRLACSLIRSLFPENPEEKKNGKVLTKEENVIVRETIDPLFNMLWLWTKTNSGDSVFEGPLGEEKYPGFELYSIIAETCHNASPENQLANPCFQKYQTKEIGNWILV